MESILSYGFMQRAIIAGLCVAAIAPLIGSFLVLRRLSLISDTIAHVALVGIAIGLLTGIYPIATTVGVTIIAAVAMEYLRSGQKLSGDSVLALFLPSGLSIALILLKLGGGYSAAIVGYLVGSIATVSATDLVVMIPLTFVSAAIVIFRYRAILLTSLDEDEAHVGGINVRQTNMLFMIVTALVVSITVRIVGALLTGALMVIPVLAAQRIAGSFRESIFVAIGFATAATVIGLLAAFTFDLPSGAVIVLASLSMFLLTKIVR